MFALHENKIHSRPHPGGHLCRFLLIAGSYAAYTASPQFLTQPGNLTKVVEYAGDCGPGSFVQFAYSNCTYCPWGTFTNTEFGCVRVN